MDRRVTAGASNGAHAAPFLVRAAVLIQWPTVPFLSPSRHHIVPFKRSSRARMPWGRLKGGARLLGPRGVRALSSNIK